jgi:hypothetical protein
MEQRLVTVEDRRSQLVADLLRDDGRRCGASGEPFEELPLLEHDRPLRLVG